MQADRSTIIKRFELGHTMLGAVTHNYLAGMLSFSYSALTIEAETIQKGSWQLL